MRSAESFDSAGAAWRELRRQMLRDKASERGNSTESVPTMEMAVI
jgi:hypothetical protein